MATSLEPNLSNSFCVLSFEIFWLQITFRFWDRTCRPIYQGQIEDTKLEAKANNTKTNPRPSQKPTFRGQSLSRPRTGMLKAKAKDKTRKCSQKKRSSRKIIANFRLTFRRFPNKKKGLHKLSARFLAFPKTKKKTGHDLEPLLTNQKIVLSLTKDFEHLHFEHV